MPCIALKRLKLHMVNSLEELTEVFEAVGRLASLTSLAFTVPVTIDAAFCSQVAGMFPRPERLTMFFYTRTAAWDWPDKEVGVSSSSPTSPALT